ncbi:MAG: hypothetical protein LBJ31_08925 [Treponema sp.]|jgi:hypothetical protein|nr:hypothetical protein [Treponema sp.]
MGPNKHIYRMAFFFMLIFFALLPAVSQSPGEREVSANGSYFIRRSNGGIEIIQRLSWPQDDNAYRYEVVIEREEGESREVYREFVNDPFVEVSLRPGNYWYYVNIFNMLNRLEYTTNRASFSVVLALQPVLQRFAPRRFYLEDGLAWDLELEGSNFIEETTVYLEPLTMEGEPVFPKDYTFSEKGARVVFDPQELKKGDYRVVVENPGGLNDSRDSLAVKLIRPQTGVSLSYAPLVPLNGYLFDLFDGFYFIGATIKADRTFLKTKWGGYFGIEGSLSWNYLSTRKNNMDVTGHLADLQAGLFLRKQMFPMVFNFYAGLGLGSVFLLEFDYRVIKSDPYNNLSPLFGVGASFQWFFNRHLYGDLGAKYIYLLTRETAHPSYIRPSLGLGWRF